MKYETIETLARKHYNEIMSRSVTAMNILRNGGSEKECIVALILREKDLENKVMELDNIRPRKYVADGKTMIMRIPEELIPVEAEFRGVND